MATESNKSVSLAIRVTPETYQTLQRAQALLPYTITATSIIERGIVLATEELERLVVSPEARR